MQRRAIPPHGLSCSSLREPNADVPPVGNDLDTEDVCEHRHIALASRQPDFAASLRAIGISAQDQPSVYDIVGGLSDAVDDYFAEVGSRTDFGEMAQMVAAESLTSLLHQGAARLFEVTGEEVQRATRELSTPKGFSTLAHDFFSRFTHRFLTYHLSRELSLHCGPNGRFVKPSEHNEFLSELNVLSRQAALILRDYAGGWYSKANFEEGITPRQARRFSSYALTKLSRELAIRGRRGE